MFEHTPYPELPIFYASWLYFPVAAWLILMLMKGARRKRLAALTLAALSVLAYARFVEPRILLTRRHEVALDRCFAQGGTLRAAVFSDTHLGIFANAMPARRIAKAVNAVDPDLVLIAGDFTYFLPPERFDRAFGRFADIEAPVFAVLGNHDVGFPGPDVGAALKEYLKSLGIVDVENRGLAFSSAVEGSTIEIVGLSDSWQKRQDMRAVASRATAPTILLTHNPNTVFDLPAGAQVDLLVAGHTHGGQIYIPGVTCAFLYIACRPFREGLKEVNGRQAFITAGTGMVGLPMRFLVPPRLDVLEIKYEKCPD